ncbi:carboxypeptidase regulatory-like domain-containing protein [Cognatitamlana onchidii]|uniref:carboxypeptidase regulatory-like domain-containing protein n=1 Tax=Cognatitamlana onchidii TaxID=2562860 RepID=UPI0010A69F7B|nr:carboxypeptidase regulatory-like domain-containing protein [Algibacter onchidii]
MKRNILTLFFLVITLFHSCSKKEDSKFFEVKGRVFLEGELVEGAEVLLKNENDNYKTVTKNDGEFIFENLNPVPYTLEVSKDLNNEGLHVKKVYNTKGNNGTELESIFLPIPVDFADPIEVSNTFINLAWNASNSDDFKEYKIYRSGSSALDEDTGILRHVSTIRNDTTFIDDQNSPLGGLYPNTDYYYRIYVMNDKGKLGGSSIYKIKTKEFANNVNTAYKLKSVTNFAVEKTVTGIEFYGSHLWIMYENGKLVKYDFKTGTNLETFILDGDFKGLAYDGTYLWTNYRVPFEGTLFQVNPIDGKIVKSFGMDPSSDLAYLNGSLYMLWRNLNQINPINGGLINQFKKPFPEATWGITARNGEIWINSYARDSNKIAILDEEGNHFGIAYISEDEHDILSNGDRYTMCFMNNQIVLSYGSRLYIYDIEKIEL